jgi:nucleotide-binding universal stress UspA family protein
MLTLERVLVATDFSEPSDAALRYGRALASQFGATLHVLHVVESVGMGGVGAESYGTTLAGLDQQLEEEARRRLHELVLDNDNSGPPTVTRTVTARSPSAAIVEYATGHAIDVIVIGTHGRRGLAHLFLGSVAERVVRTAPCPVLTVRHPEREFVRPDTLTATTPA